MNKQVNKTHYNFFDYMKMERWISLWHQINEILKLKPDNVLEVGPGPGILKNAAAAFGLSVETLDLDPDLEPDHIGSATDLSFPDNSYDVVCAFQMLEHLPYEKSLLAFSELARVCRTHIVISLPDAKVMWPYKVHIPVVGKKNFFIPRPNLRVKLHVYDGQHYWEINKKGFELSKIIEDLEDHARLIKTYRVPENPYHRFFIFGKKN